MLRNDYDGQLCSIAKSLELIGERWTLLVIRDVFNGKRRFDELQESLGIARNVLSSRLQRLVDEDILEKRAYRERPTRYEYFLAERGLDLWPVLVTMLKWGDKHLADGGPPLIVLHEECGGEVTNHLTCEKCGQPLTARDAMVRPGPGVQAPA